MNREPAIRVEKVHSSGLRGSWGQHEGWLELTPTRLVFRPLRSSGAKAAVDLPLSRIEGARAKKAFSSGSEELEVVFRDADGKRRTVKFSRMSWAAWSNDVLHGTGRSEPNSFAPFERDIAEGREQERQAMEASATSARASDRVSQLAKLAELRSSGALTEEEFQAEKARVLGS